jgi:hypothetical protein
MILKLYYNIRNRILGQTLFSTTQDLFIKFKYKSLLCIQLLNI